ncbi:hypothetical protein NI390_16400 [Vibrio fluvialis]|uniref:hypothetical protein n=2 Tax=Vibrio fluvialis TaxID=676 RepID=UPI0027E4A57A|nr:hypothetical protein [Vibrio fluvialis]WMN57870.1 hypothetical protein NI390_16400 [Vibrio fluvialis]
MGKTMFEPPSPIEEVQIAVSFPGLDSIDLGTFIPPDSLSIKQLASSSFDALIVSGLSVDKEQEIASYCEKIGTLFIIFGSPSNDKQAIKDAISNITGKLYSHEMPNNFDLADLRNLKRHSEQIYAFNDSRKTLDFLALENTGEVTGAIYLSHGRAIKNDCKDICNELLTHILRNGTLCFSSYAPAYTECTILVGINQ